MSDFIPRNDAQALAWMRSFADVIAEHFAVYALSPGDSAAISQAVDEYQAAFFAAENKTTRTQAQVSLKDELRKAAEQICRQYAIGIKFNAGISNQAKIDVGVRPINPNRDPIHCPQTSPLINVVAATPGVHTITYADSLNPDKRAKPFGSVGLHLYLHIGETIIDDENLAKFVGTFTKTPIGYEFEPDDDGKMATWFAKWVGRRGDTSPYSLPVSMRIAA